VDGVIWSDAARDTVKEGRPGMPGELDTGAASGKVAASRGAAAASGECDGDAAADADAAAGESLDIAGRSPTRPSVGTGPASIEASATWAVVTGPDA
jgi:hypothetical protein